MHIVIFSILRLNNNVRWWECLLITVSHGGRPERAKRQKSTAEQYEEKGKEQ